MTAELMNPDTNRRPSKGLGDEMLSPKKPAPSSASPKAPSATGATSVADRASFKVGRHVRYWRADLVLWLTEQTNRPQYHH